MRLKVIACKVLWREIGLLSAACPNFLDLTYLRQGYHDEPDKLRKILQAEIDRIDNDDDPYTSNKGGLDNKGFDAVLLGYGLCSNGIVGLSSKKYKLVVPKAHDCVTLFLGSRKRYREYFDQHPGTYWYTTGWMENTVMPSENYRQVYYDKYLEEYEDEDTADYLAETTCGWLSKYDRATYVSIPQLACDTEFCERSQGCAKAVNWKWDKLSGDLSLLQKFFWGQWDDDFLVIQPNEAIAQSYDEDIVKPKA